MTLNNCLIIGITGGIATGKSTLTNMIKQRKYEVIDADVISREVVEVGKPAYYDIIDYFGHEILLEDHTINRKALGNIIFNDSNMREALNSIVHPRIFKEILIKINKLSLDNDVVFLDIPLLFESFEKWKLNGIEFDEVWVVYVDYELQLKRLINRDKITKEQGILKINSQMSLDEKVKMATRVFYNDGDLIKLERDLDFVLSQLKS